MSEIEKAPVKVIAANEQITLGKLLKLNGLFDEVKTGNRIVLLEGKSLTNFDMIISPGKKLAVISFEVLGGG